MADLSNRGTDVGGIGLVTVILALVFLFVWPGPLRWQYSTGSPRTKIDRISGTTFVLTGEGWRKLATNVREEMPLAQYSDMKITQVSLPVRGRANEHELSLSVYNPSGWALTELVVEVKLGKSVKQYWLKPEATIQPGATGTVIATVPDELVIPSEDKKRDFHWSVVGAKGYPAD